MKWFLVVIHGALSLYNLLYARIAHRNGHRGWRNYFVFMVAYCLFAAAFFYLSACTLPLTKRQPTTWVTEHDVLVLVGELDDRMRAAEARMAIYEAADDDLDAELDALHLECAECMEAVR